VGGVGAGQGRVQAGARIAERWARDAARHPWLGVGDEIVYEVERLGRVAHRIVAGASADPATPLTRSILHHRRRC
jgi:hypothetical protein